jgi:hypothetical protein
VTVHGRQIHQPLQARRQFALLGQFHDVLAGLLPLLGIRDQVMNSYMHKYPFSWFMVVSGADDLAFPRSRKGYDSSDSSFCRKKLFTGRGRMAEDDLAPARSHRANQAGVPMAVRAAISWRCGWQQKKALPKLSECLQRNEFAARQETN